MQELLDRVVAPVVDNSWGPVTVLPLSQFAPLLISKTKNSANDGKKIRRTETDGKRKNGEDSSSYLTLFPSSSLQGTTPVASIWLLWFSVAVLPSLLCARFSVRRCAKTNQKAARERERERESRFFHFHSVGPPPNKACHH
ncbi:hypothetical protein QOT17_023196 [Balamuthia mandrillaris]